jgi:hypothetical protein
MRRILLGLCALLLLSAAIGWSRQRANRPDLDFALEKQNPVTHLKLNNAPDLFRFAIVSDRTGGHRARIFSQAVEQLNLLQPEFVVSVGDLIEGYTESKEQVLREWREFQNYTSRLQMPFFYVPGNHDITNLMMETVWREKFGRSYYEILYKDVLLLVLNSEDPPRKGTSNISPEQLAWLKKTLQANDKVRWTLVFLHKPMWIMSDLETNGWLEVEKLLAGRKYTVFAGHVHRYQKFVRQGQNYYMLATTGGISKLRGLEYGEFDHITWVTMKKDGPVIANVMLEGIVREDLSKIYSEEEGVAQYLRRPTTPVKGKVTYQGKPLAGAIVTFHPLSKDPGFVRADALTNAEGTFQLSTYKANDGAIPGEFAVTVELRKPLFTPEGKAGPNQLPTQFASADKTPLRVTVKREEATIDLNLQD